MGEKSEEIDIFDAIEKEDITMPLVKELKKSGKIKSIREVSPIYKLEDNESYATIQEYKEWQKKGISNKVLDANEIRAEKIEKDKDNQYRIKSLKEGIKIASVNIDNYTNNVKNFYDKQPFFYDKNKIFWFWNIIEDKWEIVDEVDLMDALDEGFHFNGTTVNSGLKANYLEAFKRIGRKKRPKEAPKKWVQFKDKAISLDSGETYTVTPDYFFTNPIPWEIGKSMDTPVIDKLFEEWVGTQYMDMLYEVIAYCCYTDYPIQIIICLHGCGRNGKGQFVKVLNRFIGHSNVCSTELDMLVGSRFEAFKLYKKLVCEMGETNFGVLKQTSMLKKLCGGDLIGFEMKNKNPFDDYNYSKMMISSNSLPTSADESDGFYRRWLIIDFPNEFKEGKDIVKTIPDYEYNNLAKKVAYILPRLLKKGSFLNQGDIKQRREKYILASNPLTIFIRQCCIKDEVEYVSYNKLYTAYVKFLIHNKKRRVKMGEFRHALETEGFWIERTSKTTDEGTFKTGNWVVGINLRKDYVNYVNYAPISIQRSL